MGTTAFDMVDRFKRIAQEVGARSNADIGRFGLEFVEWTRGESVQLFEGERFYLAHVNEGLGTKNMIADNMYYAKNAFRSYDRKIGKDAVAMIVNDMATLGAMPISLALHIVAGSHGWFHTPDGWEDRCREFLEGWFDACTESRCRFDGGETPIPSGNVRSNTAVISGSAIGIIADKRHLIRRNIRHGDSIVLLGSSGLHANGATFARGIAEKLKGRFETPISDGRMFGEALLDPTHIYVGFIEDCLNAGIKIHYGVHITGHGWRKLMRAPEKFTYVIEQFPTPQPVFDFIAQKGNVSLRDMYADYNMGAGFALYVLPGHVLRVIKLWQKGNYPLQVFGAGHIEKSKKRRVVIEQLGIQFQEDELKVR